jgi:hypothetical protein
VFGVGTNTHINTNTHLHTNFKLHPQTPGMLGVASTPVSTLMLTPSVNT